MKFGLALAHSDGLPIRKAKNCVLAREIQYHKGMNQYVVEIKTIPTYRVFAARGTAQDYRHVAQPMTALFNLLEQEFQVQKLKSAQPCVVLWHGDYRSEEPFTLEVAMGFEGQVQDSTRLVNLPSLEVVSTLHYGSFERFGDAYQALCDFIKLEGLVVNGATRELYIHVDQDETKNVAELQIPVSKSK